MSCEKFDFVFCVARECRVPDLSRDFTAVVSLPMTVEIVHKINTCLVRH